jgi:hypothetical protein
MGGGATEPETQETLCDIRPAALEESSVAEGHGAGEVRQSGPRFGALAPRL